MIPLAIGCTMGGLPGLAIHALNLALGYWAYRLARWVRSRRLGTPGRPKTRQRPGG